MRYKRTLVTGGHGLVGCTIESDFKPTSRELNLMNFDSISNYLKLHKIDSIIHCAAKVGGIGGNLDAPGEFFYQNIMINTNVLEAARVCGVKKVVSFLSTCVFPAEATYPLTPDQIHNGEPHTTNYPYASAKRMVDIMGRAYNQQYGSNFVTMIPCNVYGPNDNFDIRTGHVIPSIIHKCFLAKESGSDLNLWGTGKPLREFIYSKDLGYLARWALENYDDLEPLILSVDEEISIDKVARIICKYIGFDGDINYSQRTEGQHRKPSDNSILKEKVPNFRFTSIEEGLRETIQWFVDNYDTCRK